MIKFITAICLFLALSQKLFANYCIGVRGNGELFPALWSSLSRIIENQGMPTTAAGGSSGTVTLFYLDAISRNKFLSKNEEVKKIQQGLLFKTLMPHLDFIRKHESNFPELMAIYNGFMEKFKKGNLLTKVKASLELAKNYDKFLELIGRYSSFINPHILTGLKENFSFQKDQTLESIDKFGGFQVYSDKNLFYREGIIDFKYASVFLGRIADFYAGFGSIYTNEKLSRFIDTCSKESTGLQWKEIISKNPQCKKLFNDSLAKYYKLNDHRYKNKPIKYKKSFPNKMVMERIGSGLKVFPTTSVILSSSAKKYIKGLKRYKKNEAKNIRPFVINNQNHLRFAYWGDSDSLRKIYHTLKKDYKNDLKSQKYLPIPYARWFEALAVSPAEPGLSRIELIPNSSFFGEPQRQKIINKPHLKKNFLKFWSPIEPLLWHDMENPNKSYLPYRAGMVSAGGWSDLHPSIVLKASGCNDIMYLSRKDGESIFAQQVFLSLTGENKVIPFWKDLPRYNAVGWKLYSDEEINSGWNRLYNLDNPNSSYNLSVKIADSVYCTDWNKQKFSKEGFDALMTDAYNAPLILKDESRRSEFNFGYNELAKDQEIYGCIPKLGN